jgi:glycerol-3-phosphate dehydrogenase
MAPQVAALLAQELGHDKAWQLDQIEQFNKVAAGFMVKA